MGEIAEKCPASNECRREITECRREQRKQSQWLYKVVEIGAATNFVADTLLKKRAGENVVALMSAVLPVMSESACDDLLLKLFEAVGAPLDKTPGFGQLRSFRETLTPLARKTQFKDRVFQYHLLAKQLLAETGSADPLSPFESIPNAVTASQVILLLFKVMQEDSQLIIEYYGLKGSGWVIAYARHVLGLPVCILRSVSSPVPISGDYQTARVFVHIYIGEGICKLLMKGQVQDMFVIDSVGKGGRDGWSIDVDNTNIFTSFIPETGPLKAVLSFIACCMVKHYTELMSEQLSQSPGSTYSSSLLAGGLVNYPLYCLPSVQQKAHKILGLLGFAGADMDAASRDGWHQYLDSPAPEYDSKDLSLNLSPGPQWLASGLGHIVPRDDGQKTILSPDSEPCHTGYEFDEEAEGYLSFVLSMSWAVSSLAFTNWDQSLRSISLTYFEEFTGWYFFTADLGMIPFQGILDTVLDLAEIARRTKTIAICRDTDWSPKLSEDNLLAFHDSGIVFYNVAAVVPALEFDGCYLHVLPGSIVAHGERRDRILAETRTDMPIENVEPYPAISRSGTYTPINMFPRMEIFTHIGLHGNTLVLNQAAEFGSGLRQLNTPGHIARVRTTLLVTSGCSHGYYATSTSAPAILGLNNGTSYGELWLHAVDQNTVGQWVACQSYDSYASITILQRNCCLECTINRLNAASKWISGNRGDDYEIDKSRIIFGRREGEEME
ncbi:MAG: hypothetical protein Q9164_000759 [Protoblastenia rupestris]